MVEFNEFEDRFMYRIELYLIHKYQPELVHEMKISFARARLRRESVLKHSENIIMTKEDLMIQIQNDLSSHVRWKPKNSTHKRTSIERPGISAPYQRQFEEL